MALEDAELKIVLRAVGTELLSAMNQMQSSVASATAGIRENFQATSHSVGTSMSAIRERVTLGLGGIQGQIRAFGTIAEVALAILGVERAISNIVRSDQDWAKEAEHLHLALNLNFNDVATLAVAAKEADAPIEQLDALIRTLGRTLNTNEKELHNVGVAVRDSSGAFLPLFTILENSIHTIDEYKRGTDQLVIAQRIFGRSANEETVDALRRTIENLDRARIVAKDFGLVVGGDGVVAAQALTRAEADLGFAFLGVKNIIAQALRPELETVIQYVTNLAHSGDLQNFAREAGQELVGLGTDIVRVSEFLLLQKDVVLAATAAWGAYKLAVLISANAEVAVAALNKMTAAIKEVQAAQLTLPIATSVAAGLTSVGAAAEATTRAAQIGVGTVATAISAAAAKQIAVAKELAVSTDEVTVAFAGAELSGLTFETEMARLAVAGTTAAAGLQNLTLGVSEAAGAGVFLIQSTEAEAAALALEAEAATVATAGIGGLGISLAGVGAAATAAFATLSPATWVAIGVGVLAYTGLWRTLLETVKELPTEIESDLRPELFLLSDAFAGITTQIEELTGLPVITWISDLKDAVHDLWAEIKDAPVLPQIAKDFLEFVLPGINEARKALAAYEQFKHPDIAFPPLSTTSKSDLQEELNRSQRALLSFRQEVQTSQAEVDRLGKNSKTSVDDYTAAVEKLDTAQKKYNEQLNITRVIRETLGLKPLELPTEGKNAPISLEDQLKVQKAAFSALQATQAEELAAVDRNQAAKLVIVKEFYEKVKALSRLSESDIARFTAPISGPAEAVKAITTAETPGKTQDLLRVNSIKELITANRLLVDETRKTERETDAITEEGLKLQQDQALKSLDIAKHTVEEKRKLGQLTFEGAADAEIDIEERRLAVVREYIEKRIAIEAGGVDKVIEIQARIAAASPPELQGASTGAQTNFLAVNAPAKLEEIRAASPTIDFNALLKGFEQLDAAAADTAAKINAIVIKFRDEELKQQASEIRGLFDAAFGDIASAAQRFGSALANGFDQGTQNLAPLRSELRNAQVDLTEIARTAGRNSQAWITAKNQETEAQYRLNNAVHQQSVVQKALLDVGREVYSQAISQVTGFTLEVIKFAALRVIAEKTGNQQIFNSDQVTGAARLALRVSDWALERLGFQAKEIAKTTTLSQQDAVRLLLGRTDLSKDQATWLLEVAGFRAKETAKTTAKITSETAQVGATQVAATAKGAIELAETDKSIFRSAADAAAKAYSALAGVYIIGPVLGAIAAAATFAAVLAFGSGITAEQGDISTPEGLAFLHPEERVFPPASAARLRALITGGAAPSASPDAGFDVPARGAVRPLAGGSLVLPKGLAADVRASTAGRPSAPGSTTTGSSAVPAGLAGSEKLLGAGLSAETLKAKALAGGVGVQSLAEKPAAGQPPSSEKEAKAGDISAELGATATPAGARTFLHPEERVLDPAIAKTVLHLATTPAGQAILHGAASFDVPAEGAVLELPAGSMVLPKPVATAVREAVPVEKRTSQAAGPAQITAALATHAATAAQGDQATLPGIPTILHPGERVLLPEVAGEVIRRSRDEAQAPGVAGPGAGGTTIGTGSSIVPTPPSLNRLLTGSSAEHVHATILQQLIAAGAVPAATGIHRVAEDNTVAILHRDERVLTAPEATNIDTSLVVRGDTGQEHRTAPVTGGPTGTDLGNAGDGKGGPGGGGHPGRVDHDHKGTVEHKHEAKSPGGFAPNLSVTGFAGAGGSGKVQDVKIVASTPTLATKSHGGEITLAPGKTPLTTTPAGDVTPVSEQGVKTVIVQNKVPVSFSAFGISAAITTFAAPFGIGVGVGVGFNTLSAFGKGGEVPEDMLAKVHEKEIILEPGLAQGFKSIIERQSGELNRPGLGLAAPSLAPTDVLRQAGLERHLTERDRTSSVEHAGPVEEHYHNETIAIQAWDSEDVGRFVHRHGRDFHAVTTRITKEKQARRPRRF